MMGIFVAGLRKFIRAQACAMCKFSTLKETSFCYGGRPITTMQAEESERSSARIIPLRFHV